MPPELRKDIERIHRNLGHASADQLEKLFRDASVSDDAISALKNFRCDACDRLKRPPKTSSRGSKHGASERHIMFFKAKEMLKKARQSKHGGHPTILAR